MASASTPPIKPTLDSDCEASTNACGWSAAQPAWNLSPEQERNCWSRFHWGRRSDIHMRRPAACQEWTSWRPGRVTTMWSCARPVGLRGGSAGHLSFSSLLLHRLCFDLDLDAVGHQNAPGLERLVPA